MLSKKQKKLLKENTCPLCQAHTLTEYGDLADFKHDMVACTNEPCRFVLMFDGTILENC